MHTDPVMLDVVALLLFVVVIGLASRILRQPQLITYLLAGIVAGPHGLSLISDQALIARIGEFGVVLLLFFAGLEISLPRLFAAWRVPILGTLTQIAVSVALTFSIGSWLSWPWPRSLMLGFVVSLSSTAVVLSLLSAWRESDTPTGRDVVGILLAQDILVVPMLLTLSLISGGGVSGWQLAIQIVAGAIIISLIAWLLRDKPVVLPLRRIFGADRELELFGAFMVCFGVALLTGLAGLSIALGGFVAGLIVGASDEREWFHEALSPFRIVFVAVFFMSIGMLIDLTFIVENAGVVTSLAGVALLSNTLINGSILRASARSWRQSLYTAGLLAPIGEFSFVLAAVGYERGIIASYGYELTVAVIAATLITSPLWIALMRIITGNPRFSPSAARIER